ncbi:hypothetical protein WDW86_00110, partial [Bdellovibrionota bacterium FG-2]
VKMPIRQKGVLGNTVTSYQWFDSALNPELLQHIAEITEGRFYRVTDEGSLQEVFKEIDQLERTEIKAKENVKYEENFAKFLKLALLLLLLELVLSRFWWRVLP